MQTKEDPRVIQIEGIARLIVGGILFLTVLIYAGIRGSFAYNHAPAVQVNFASNNNLNFPAITVCPMYPTTITAVECVKETKEVDGTNCIGFVYPKQYMIEGIMFGCLTFNDPPVSSNVITSTSIADELALRVAVNTTVIPALEDVGILVTVHPQHTDPVISQQNSFVADVAKLAECWLRLDRLVRLDGSTQDNYSISVSSVTVQPGPNGEQLNVVDLDFVFMQQGIFMNNQYYVYTQYNWYGEVGGFACLMLFLYWAVMFIAGLIIRRALKNRHARLSEQGSNL